MRIRDDLRNWYCLADGLQKYFFIIINEALRPLVRMNRRVWEFLQLLPGREWGYGQRPAFLPRLYCLDTRGEGATGLQMPSMRSFRTSHGNVFHSIYQSLPGDPTLTSSNALPSSHQVMILYSLQRETRMPSRVKNWPPTRRNSQGQCSCTEWTRLVKLIRLTFNKFKSRIKYLITCPSRHANSDDMVHVADWKLLRWTAALYTVLYRYDFFPLFQSLVPIHTRHVHSRDEKVLGLLAIGVASRVVVKSILSLIAHKS